MNNLPHPEPDLAALVRELHDEPDPAHTMRRVADGALDLIAACVSASVSTADRGTLLRCAASTDDTAAAGDALQAELEEGPCVAATWEQPYTLANDLTTEARWPRWAPRVVEALGIRSMLCVRLYTNSDRIGALNLYADTTHAFDQDDIDAVTALAAHSSVAIATATQSEHLQTALSTRTTIAQAVGLLMERHGVTSDMAFRLLARHSSHQNRKLRVIAEELVTKHNHESLASQLVRDTIRPERTSPKPGSRKRPRIDIPDGSAS